MPDEEDYDEFDDVLDQFTTPPPPPQQPPPPHASTSRAPTDAAPLEEDDFMRELAKGMETLMRELVDGGPSSGPPLGAASDSGSVSGEPPHGEDASPADFQRKIREAVDKLNAGEAGPSADPQGSKEATEALAQLLSQFGSGENLSDGDEAEFHGFLEGMMTQLMSKEVLYEPLKELSEKFPPYLASPPPSASLSDLGRYRKQHAIATQIVAVFEEPGYHDDSAPLLSQGQGDASSPQQQGGGGRYTERVVSLMGELQALGSPPPEIMGPLPSGLNLGPEGTPDCVVT